MKTKRIKFTAEEAKAFDALYDVLEFGTSLEGLLSRISDSMMDTLLEKGKKSEYESVDFEVPGFGRFDLEFRRVGEFSVGDMITGDEYLRVPVGTKVATKINTSWIKISNQCWQNCESLVEVPSKEMLLPRKIVALP